MKLRLLNAKIAAAMTTAANSSWVFISSWKIPLVMLFVVHLMQTATTGIVDPAVYMICFMSLTTPTAATMVQLAQLFTDDAHYVSCISSVAIVFSLITIPVMMSLYFAW